MIPGIGKIGIPELVLILAIALIIFGPRKLPEIGKSIGNGIREFRSATSEIKKSVDVEDTGESEEKKTGSKQQKSTEQENSSSQESSSSTQEEDNKETQ